MKDDAARRDVPEPAAADPAEPRAVRRRRPLVIGALGLAVVLVAGSLTWWGVARSEAHARADALVTRVLSAEADAQKAAEDAAAATTALEDLDDTAVSRILALAESSPDVLSPDLSTALAEAHGEASDAVAGADAGTAPPAADFPRTADELTDPLLWGDADGIEAAAAAEVARLGDDLRRAREHADRVGLVIAQVVDSLAAVGTDTGDRAAAAHDRLEHAGDHRAALAEHAAALRDLSTAAGDSTDGTAWLPLVERLESYSEAVAAAQGAHDERVAQIEAEQRAEAERQAAAQRQAEAEQRARESSGSGGGSGGGGSGGGGSGGGGSGGDWCPEVNWTGYIILVPC